MRVWAGALSQHGIALLELSAVSVVLLPVFLAALVVIQSFGLSLRLSEIVEYALRSDETVPLKIQNSETGFMRVEIDRDGIDRSINSLLVRLESALAEDSPNITAERYRIEVTVGLVEVEQSSGRANPSSIQIRSRAVGGAAVSSFDRESTDPLMTFAAIAGVFGGEGGASALARELPGRESGYAPIAPLLHVRIFRSADPDIVRLLREAIGLKPYISAAEVALLRTEVGV